MTRIKRFFIVVLILVASFIFVNSMHAAEIEITPEDEEILIEALAEKSFTFPPIAVDKSKPRSAVLVMEAHIRSDTVSGYCENAMMLEMNGITIEGPRLVNKPLESKFGTKERIQPWIYPPSKRWTLVHSHDFVSPDRNETYRIEGGGTCRFEFDIIDLVSDEKLNKITIHNTREERQVVVRNIAVKYDSEIKTSEKDESPSISTKDSGKESENGPYKIDKKHLAPYAF